MLFVWTGGTLGFHLVCSVVWTHSVWSEVETGFWSSWLVCDLNDCPIRKELGTLALGATAWCVLLWAAFLFLVGGNVLFGLPSPVTAQTLAGIGLGA